MQAVPIVVGTDTFRDRIDEDDDLDPVDFTLSAYALGILSWSTHVKTRGSQVGRPSGSQTTLALALEREQSPTDTESLYHGLPCNQPSREEQLDVAVMQDAWNLKVEAIS